MKFEIFSDLGYYGMWCLKPVDCTEFAKTLHFQSYKEAKDSFNVLQAWFNDIELIEK